MSNILKLLQELILSDIYKPNDLLSNNKDIST